MLLILKSISIQIQTLQHLHRDRHIYYPVYVRLEALHVCA